MMKAAVCREFGKPLSIEHVNLRAPLPGEIEVKIEACAICHSDIHFIDGAWDTELPAIYGHEAAGRVVSVGDGVNSYKPGDPVLVTLIRACGECWNCCDGHPANCGFASNLPDGPHSAADGTPLLQGLKTAAFAERTVVDPSQIVKFPESVSMEAAALMACGVITGVGAAINTAKVRPGTTVAVIGAGGVGLNAIQGALIAGAAKIIAVDTRSEKLEAAREFGATHCVLATEEKPHRQVKALNGGQGVDYVMVTVGSTDVYNLAPRYLAYGGKVIIVGMTPSGENSFYQPVAIAATGQAMLGSSMGDTVLRRDVPYLMELYRQGRLKLDELITGRYSLENINDAIAATKSGLSRRNVILF
ncbi:MAG: Zn-dependent alcohol dehydrogenase [Albidovulum sp.]|nr:Zn-dependent alcohol dehydrogenase [Albidovulum sp.]